jgi:hypothetical protein
MAGDDGSFDEKALAADLKAWWDSEVSGEDDPFAPPKMPAGTIFDALPAIDSLGVVSALLTVEKHVPFKVTPKLIRPGGYNSFEDLVGDFTPKLMALTAKHNDSKKPNKPNKPKEGK